MRRTTLGTVLTAPRTAVFDLFPRAHVRRWGARVVAAVWLHQGLWSKVLAQDPDDEDIVADVPFVGPRRARAATAAIGAVEVGVALWVLSGRRPVAAAATQTGLVVGMNAGGLAMSGDRISRPARMLVRNLAFLALVWTVAVLRRSP